MYSGGKEGIIKVWTTKNQKIDCLATLSGHASSINTLCKIEHPNGKMFASGSSDKAIKMWKLKDQYLENASDEEEDSDSESQVEETKEGKTKATKQKLTNLQQMRLNKKAKTRTDM